MIRLLVWSDPSALAVLRRPRRIPIAEGVHDVNGVRESLWAPFSGTVQTNWPVFSIGGPIGCQTVFGPSPRTEMTTGFGPRWRSLGMPDDGDLARVGAGAHLDRVEFDRRRRGIDLDEILRPVAGGGGRVAQVQSRLRDERLARRSPRRRGRRGKATCDRVVVATAQVRPPSWVT